MWSTFIVQNEDASGSAARGPEALAGMMGARSGGKKRRARAASPTLSETQEGKIKLAFLVAMVGITLTVLAVGTEFWVEMAPAKNFYNETCMAAHYGLWKSCIKTLLIADVDPERKTCGPLDLPGGKGLTMILVSIDIRV